jgi:hypothetical protein
LCLDPRVEPVRERTCFAHRPPTRQGDANAAILFHRDDVAACARMADKNRGRILGARDSRLGTRSGVEWESGLHQTTARSADVKPSVPTCDQPSFRVTRPSFDVAGPSFWVAGPSFWVARPSIRVARPFLRVERPSFTTFLRQSFDVSRPFSPSFSARARHHEQRVAQLFSRNIDPRVLLEADRRNLGRGFWSLWR